MNKWNNLTKAYILFILLSLFFFTSPSVKAQIEQWLEKIGSASVAESQAICAELCKQGETKITELCQHIKPQGDDHNPQRCKILLQKDLSPH